MSALEPDAKTTQCLTDQAIVAMVDLMRECPSSGVDSRSAAIVYAAELIADELRLLRHAIDKEPGR